MQKWGIRGRVVGSLIVMGSLLDSRPPALVAADEYSEAITRAVRCCLGVPTESW